MSNEKPHQVTVRNTDELRLALAAGYEGSQITIAPPDSAEAIAAARAEGVTEGKADAAKDAVAAERKRIAEIQALARAGFERELAAAIDHGDSPEAFALTLLKAAQDRGITLEAIKRDSPAPAPHANPGIGQGKASWDQTIKKFGGKSS